MSQHFKVDAASPLEALRQLVEQFRAQGLPGGLWEYAEADETHVVFAIGTVTQDRPPKAMVAAEVTPAQRKALDKLDAWEKRQGTQPWAIPDGVRSDLITRLVSMGLLLAFTKMDVRPQRRARYRLSPAAKESK